MRPPVRDAIGVESDAARRDAVDATPNAGYGVAEVLDAVLPAVDNAIELRRQQIEQLDAKAYS